MFYKKVLILFSFSLFAYSSSDIKNLESFYSNFKQEITSSSKNVIEYKGKVFIKKNGKILWKYETPVIKNVYIDNSMAIVDEPDLEQVIFTQLQSEINIIKLLNDAKKVDNETLTSTIEDIKYTIKSKDNKIEKILYQDTLDNSVEILFSNVVQNESISDDIFKFIIPSHYDVIRK